MDKIKELCIKHREILVYIIVGGLTTVVAWGCKFLWNAVFYAVISPGQYKITVYTVPKSSGGIS